MKSMGLADPHLGPSKSPKKLKTVPNGPQKTSDQPEYSELKKEEEEEQDSSESVWSSVDDFK